MKAVIFDFDGVIADSVMAHYSAERDILKRYGIDFTLEEYKAKYTGMPVKEIFRKVLELNGKDADLDRLVKEKFHAVESNADKVEPIEGIFELVKFLSDEGFRLAVASGAHRSFVNMILKNMDLEGYFEQVLTLEDAKRGKPEPDIYLNTAKAMGLPANECVVIEDGIQGMIAANKAGMKCIGLVSDDKEYPCDIRVRSLTEIKHKIGEL